MGSLPKAQNRVLPLLGTVTVIALISSILGFTWLRLPSPADQIQPASITLEASAAMTPTMPNQPTGTPIGDGSMMSGGKQPKQPTPKKLQPGDTPPQFVVLSWDGAASPELNRRFREAVRPYGGSMTYFLSGLYFLPKSHRSDYVGPRHAPGASDIDFLTPDNQKETISEIGAAWNDGHEIGTHFNGHFCGDNGVSEWTPKEWESEISQAVDFVSTWKTTTGFTDVPALPFDYTEELVGSRTPCLQGQKGLLPAAQKLGWKYDSSGVGRQTWPKHFAGKQGLWNIPMPLVKYGDRKVIAMDYNFMVVHSDGKPQGNDPAKFQGWEDATHKSLVDAFELSRTTNRAPLILGNHFNEWNGGIYMNAVERSIKTMGDTGDVQFVSFRQLVEWLEVQDPAVLKKLQGLKEGQKPPGGWSTYLGAPPRTAKPQPTATTTTNPGSMDS